VCARVRLVLVKQKLIEAKKATQPALTQRR
jgi:hypothetical protein